jgi:hypothetical protein
VANLERIVCVYDLMMKRIIEQMGTWPQANASDNDAELNRLIERVQSTGCGSPSTIRPALENAVRQDNLICERDNGGIRWRWRDYL